MKIYISSIYSLIFCSFFSQSWERVSTTNGPVYCLESHNNKLTAGGHFSSTNGNFTSTIADWDANSWIQLGFGNLFDEFETCTNLKSYNGTLYAGGLMEISGMNQYSSSMAKLDDFQWNGNMFNQSAYFCLSLAKKSIIEFQGSIYAVGDFCNEYDTCGYANFIARSTGGNWLPLDNCLTDNNSATTVVKSMAIFQDKLFMSIQGWREEPMTYDILATWDGAIFEIIFMTPSFEPHSFPTSLGSVGNELFAICDDFRIGKWNGSTFDFSEYNSSGNQYYEILNEINGELYMSSSQGIVRFDGIEMTQLPQFNESPFCLVEFAGEIYIGTSDGVFKMNTLSLDEHSYNSVKAYPNPTNSSLVLKNASKIISITDNVGNSVPFTFQTITQGIVVNKGKLAAGVYLVKTIDLTGNMNTLKIQFY
jgi:hypothetical protein